MDIETINNNKILLVEDDPQDVKMTLAALNESHLAIIAFHYKRHQKELAGQIGINT